MAEFFYGEEIGIYIARLDPPLKRRDCGEHSVQVIPLESGAGEAILFLKIVCQKDIWRK